MHIRGPSSAGGPAGRRRALCTGAHRGASAATPTRAPHDAVPRVVDAHRDRPRSRRRRARGRSSRPSRRCCATCARPSRTGSGCTRRRVDIVDGPGEEPPPLPQQEIERGAGAAELAGRRPLHLPRLPRVRPLEASSGERRAACRSRAPVSASCAPTRTCPPSFGKLPPRSRPRRARSPCSSSPRRTPRPRCTDRSTSTTSASRPSTSRARWWASGGSWGSSPRPPTPSR